MLGTSAEEYHVFDVTLKRPDGVADGGVGVILTGSPDLGADNQIIVSRVITGSVADGHVEVRCDSMLFDRHGDQDPVFLQKRDRVLFVQGQKTNAMTPGEARQLLKAPGATIHLIVARKRFNDHHDDHSPSGDSVRRSLGAEMEMVPERQ